MPEGTPQSTATGGGIALHVMGAAGTVTGSRYLLSAPGSPGLLIDYGLFQGNHELQARNLAAPDAETLAAPALVLTHAHLDHSGALPVLVKDGWRGTPYATPATAALCSLLLPDSGRIQEEDAAHRRKKGDGDQPAEPLYTEDDAINAARRLVPKLYGTAFEPMSGITTTFLRAGHIPGSSLALIEAPTRAGGRRRILFSGDLGRYGAPILPDPDPPPACDFIVVESTYGDRDHPAGSADQILGAALEVAIRNGGPILIPAFAVGRTQELLYALRRLEDDGAIPQLPVYVDSPLAIGATAVLAAHPEEYDEEMAQRIRNGSHPLEPHQLTLVRSPDQSKQLNGLSEPAIVIAGSGMATGGRILHHLEHHLEDPNTTVMFAGYQGEGTLGRHLLDGAKAIRMYGHEVAVNAHIMDVQGLSAHADRQEVLRWLRGAPRPPRRVFLVHGEPQSTAALAELIKQQLGWEVVAPAIGDRISLE